jgi:hypothetical protein
MVQFLLKYALNECMLDYHLSFSKFADKKADSIKNLI